MWPSRSCARGPFFPGWLLTRHRRAEAALTTDVATCYLPVVSTRRMDTLVQSLGIIVSGMSIQKILRTLRPLKQVTVRIASHDHLAEDPITEPAREILDALDLPPH